MPVTYNAWENCISQLVSIKSDQWWTCFFFLRMPTIDVVFVFIFIYFLFHIAPDLSPPRGHGLETNLDENVVNLLIEGPYTAMQRQKKLLQFWMTVC